MPKRLPIFCVLVCLFLHFPIMAHDRNPLGEFKILDKEEIIKELTEKKYFIPVKGHYSEFLHKEYQDAMGLVSAFRHHRTPRNGEAVLDPTFESHESLHGTSSLWRQSNGFDANAGFDIVYLGNGKFARFWINPAIKKNFFADTFPELLRGMTIVQWHFFKPWWGDLPQYANTPRFDTASAIHIMEELANHVSDGRIGLDDYNYLRGLPLSFSSATSPAMDWAAIVLGTLSRLDETQNVFPTEEQRLPFYAAMRGLIEEAVTLYARGRDAVKYPQLASLSPDQTTLSFLQEENTEAAGHVRAFCAKRFGKTWLSDQVAITRLAPTAKPEPKK